MFAILMSAFLSAVAVSAIVVVVIVVSVLTLSAGSVFAQSPATTLDTRNGHGLTPLVVAASQGDTASVKSLLAEGAHVNATAADGRTPLIAAAQSGNLDTVVALVAAGANLNRGWRGGGTALNIAENTGQSQIAALLLASGAQSTGKSVGDTVCVRPWSGDGFCGTVRSFSPRSVEIDITRIVGCAGACPARQDCSEARPVGGVNGIQAGDHVAVPSWCLTQTGVKP